MMAGGWQQREAALAGVAAQRARAAEGRAFALAWRARTKPYFDAIYGPEPRDA